MEKNDKNAPDGSERPVWRDKKGGCEIMSTKFGDLKYCKLD